MPDVLREQLQSLKKKVTDSKYVIRNEVHTKKLMEFNALSFNHFGCTFAIDMTGKSICSNIWIIIYYLFNKSWLIILLTKLP